MANPSYGDAIWGGLMISLSKLILMSFGCGPAILATAKFYKITLPFSILMAISVYFLNDVLIDIYSINGAALSTLLVVSIFTIVKIIYIKFKLNISPYSVHSLKVLLIICAIYLLFEFIAFSFSNILEILINTLLIAAIYSFLIYKSKSSGAINSFINNLLKGKLRL